MLVLGLILFCAAAAAIAGVVVAGGSPAALQFFDTNVLHTTNTSVYILGAITGVVLAIGLSLLLGGLGRRLRRRRMERAAAREQLAREESLRDHNDRLQQELARERASRSARTAPGSTGDAALDTVMANRERLHRDGQSAGQTDGHPDGMADGMTDGMADGMAEPTYVDVRDRERVGASAGGQADGGRRWLHRDRHHVEPD